MIGYLVLDGQIKKRLVEMPSNWATGKTQNGLLVWRPAAITNANYDNEIQTRTGPVETIEDTQVRADYTIQDKPLDDVKASFAAKFKVQGRAIIEAKHSPEDQRNANANRLPQGEVDQQNTDIAIIRNYWKDTLKPAINACTTVQEVKAITANWPTI